MKYIDAEKLKVLLSELKKDHEHCRGFHDGVVYFHEGVVSAVDEIMEEITALQHEQPELPDNLDEAARDYGFSCYKRACFHPEHIWPSTTEEAFKAGAEWMAKQGVILNLPIDELSCGAYNSCVEQGLTSEDDVIIQIRKK